MLERLQKIVKSEFYIFLITPALIWLAAFLMIPIIFVAILSLSTGQVSSLVDSFSLEHFQEVLSFAHVIIVMRSILLASCTAIMSLVLAYPVAYFLALYVKRFKFLFLFLLSVPFLINVLVQVYAWFFILEKNGLFNQFLVFLGLVDKPVHFLNSYFAVYLVMFHVYLPFMIMPIYSALEKIDVKLIEASYDLGANFYTTFKKIILPLSMSGVRAGFFLVYVVSFGECVIPALLGGLKVFFVGTLLSEYFFIGKDWHTGAAFVCLSCTILFFTAIIYHLIFNKITIQSKIIR